MKLPHFSCLIFLALTAARSLFAAEITGKVRGTNGDVATVAIDGDAFPAVGDKVAIFFKMAGFDDEVSVASGHVAEIVNESIKVKIENSSGTVVADQLARITSENPRKRGAVAEAKSVTPSPAPSPQSPKKQSGGTIAIPPEVVVRASQIVTFEELAPGPLASDAFAKHGLRFVPAKGVPGIYKAEPNMILPSPCTKVMLLGGERVTSFAIILDPPVKRVALYRIGTANGASVPTWKMKAYNAKGKVVGATGEQHHLPLQAKYFGVDAENITRVEVSTDNRYGTGTWATWNSLPIAGFRFDR